jgi:uncharacterized protein with PIN domain
MSEPKSIVELAVEALRTLGVKDRPTAERLLSSWAHHKDLTEQQQVEVLDQFSAEHISRITRCEVCAGLIEYVDGIENPFWRHVDAVPHAAKPKVVFS